MYTSSILHFYLHCFSSFNASKNTCLPCRMAWVKWISKNTCLKYINLIIFILFIFTARQASVPDNIGFCHHGFPNVHCHPRMWLYSLKIRQNCHTWWVRDCKFDPSTLTICNRWSHLFNSMVCYTVRCP